jgi:hypothetical protein
LPELGHYYFDEDIRYWQVAFRSEDVVEVAGETIHPAQQPGLGTSATALPPPRTASVLSRAAMAQATRGVRASSLSIRHGGAGVDANAGCAPFAAAAPEVR